MRTANDKETLDRIGKTLVTRAALRGAELDEIAGREGLLAGVAKRAAMQEPVAVRRFSLRIGLAYASVSVAVAVVATLTAMTLLRTAEVQPTTVAHNVPVMEPDTAVPQPVRPPQDEPQAPSRLTAGSGDQRMIMADSRTVTSTPRREVNSRPTIQPQSADDDFYPVSYSDGEALAGSRIVRVDMPRAQAFAMGIRVPLENDSDTIKADIVVGPDGVPRAVRLVK